MSDTFTAANGLRMRLPANFTPRAYQRPIMGHFDHGGKRAWWCVHRRGGKDRTMLAQISKMAFQRVGAYWHMLPTLRQARTSVWDNITPEGRNLIDSTYPREVVAAKNEVEMKITLKNGSIIQLLAADNFDRNVGASPVHVTFSEYSLQHPRGWHLVRPILSENNGSAAFISTPRGYNDFHALREAAIGENAINPGRWYVATMDILHTISRGGQITKELVDQEIREGMPREMARQEYYCDFAAANVGAILGSYLEEAEKEGRIFDFTQDPHGAGLELSGDLGFHDTAAWWLWQRLPGKWFANLGFDEDTGLDAGDWIKRFQENGWTNGMIGRLWLPHDAKAKTFVTKHSAMEQFMSAGYNVAIVPSLSVADRINAARSVAKRTLWSRGACNEGLKGLRAWQYKYDEERRVFSKAPDHNWASHTSDGWSYGAVVMGATGIPAPPPPAPPPVERNTQTSLNMTMDQLFEAHNV